MIKYAFFGSSSFSVTVLDTMEKLGHLPHCLVTSPDKPVGRRQALTPNVVKTWGIQRGIPVCDLPPKKLKEFLSHADHELFVVASYGRIIPEEVISLPSHGTLNIHPSLLPKYRGPSPLPTAILDDSKRTGVTIMRLDAEMDHGPIVAQREIVIDEWPVYEKFEEMMARQGAELLVSVMPDWVQGKLVEKEQNHGEATYTRKISKEDALIDLGAHAYSNWRKVQAFHAWPQAFFLHRFNGKDMKVKVTEASYDSRADRLKIEKVVPEGSAPMSFRDFVSGYGMPSGLSL